MRIPSGGFAGCLCIGNFPAYPPKQRAGPRPDPLEIVSLTPLPHILESARGY